MGKPKIQGKETKGKAMFQDMDCKGSGLGKKTVWEKK